MIERKKDNRSQITMLSLETLVRKDHLLRKIEAAIDFSKIYEIVEGLYCPDNGRPGVDPVVLFKIVLIQHLFGIASLRQTLREIYDNNAYRWFIGYGLNEVIPHFATVSYNFVNRFKESTIRLVFEWILEEVAKAGFLSTDMVFIDATHVKASANVNKKVKKEIPQKAKVYEKQLMEEVNADRAAHGKKPFDDDPNVGGGVKETTVSNTDTESGLFHKGNHKMCFAYGAHTVCDRHNFILDVEVTAGNVHDSVVFDPLYERITEAFPQIEIIAMDSAYKTPWICKRILDDGRIPSLPYRIPMTKKGGHKWYEYVYDEYYDCVICPEYELLEYRATNRGGCREYKSKAQICQNCKTLKLCTESKTCQKTVARHIWSEYLERAEDIRHSDIGKESYSLRKETIERVFADAKEKHGMRYTQHRGLKRVANWIRMKYAAMNLKKMAMWKAKDILFLFFKVLRELTAITNPCVV